MQDGDAGALFSRAVRETLDTVVAPLVREALIHDALILAGLSAMPRDRTGMVSFATGALRTVTERALGYELAKSVADEIRRVVGPARGSPPSPAADEHRPSSPGRVMRSGSPGARRAPAPQSGARRPAVPRPLPDPMTPVPVSRRRKTPLPGPATAVAESEPPTVRAPPTTDAAFARAPSSHPAPPVSGSAPRPVCVLVATGDPVVLDIISECFEHRASLHHVATLVDLIRAVDHAGGRRVLLVVDGKSPPVSPRSLAMVLEELPHVAVVVCRAPRASLDGALSSSSAAASWFVYHELTPIEDVARECVRLAS
jgi:hypothetical protein